MIALRFLAICIVWTLSLHLLPAFAQHQNPSARPRIALVLSGGGARGFAHVGILRGLQEMRIPIDIVVGTSMGSVIGGAYAAGVSVDQLAGIIRETDWDSVIADRPARDGLTFRRREDDLLLPSRIEFSANRSGLSLPPAVAGNAALELALAQLLPGNTRDLPVNRLPLPFRSVASDLLTGELVELIDTPLFLAIRASLAVPGVFAPVRVKQRLLVDGGLVRNLPVDMARAMGADIVIAVNVGTPLAPESELGSAVGVAQQMLQILTEQNVQRSIKELGPQDILISPELNGVSFLDFKSHARAISAGEHAVRALAQRLAPLALDAGAYAVTEGRRLAAPAREDQPLPLARLQVQHQGKINPQALNRQSGLREGDLVSLAQVRQAIGNLYGRADLARVESEVSDENGQRSVLIKSSDADWASSRLRVGLELASDFSDSNTFALKLMHVGSSLNNWGAELRTNAQIGSTRGVKMELWQPLGPGAQWYLAPSLGYNASTIDGFIEGRRLYRRGYDLRTATAQIGYQLGNWGDVHLGIRRSKLNARFAIPDIQELPQENLFDTTQFVNFRVDSLDSLAFPSSGFLIDASWERSPSTRPDQPSLASSSVQALSAFHNGNWAGHLYGEWARAQQGSAPLSLGGFLRLSGTQNGSIQGRSVALARAVMARRIGFLPSVLGGVMRVGFSAELGGSFDQDQALEKQSFKLAGSGFFAVDTRFGPLYLAAGATYHDRRTLYLFLGPPW